MRSQIWLGVLLGATALSAAVFQPYKPETFEYYQAEKVAHLSTEPQTILQQTRTPDFAYGDLAQRRTDFQVFRSQTPKEVAWYLEEVFALTDSAAVEWREAMSALSEGKAPALMDENYSAILGRLKTLKTPSDLLDFEAMLADAIQAQWDYLAAWRESKNPQFHDWDHDLLAHSHARLSAAYAFLMKRYPHEDLHNQKAFRDHLNALDFLS